VIVINCWLMNLVLQSPDLKTLNNMCDNCNQPFTETTDSKPLWMRTKRDTSKIVVCETCKGTALTRYVNDNPYYDGPHLIPCYACRGMGRVRREVVTEHFVLKQEELGKYTYWKNLKLNLYGQNWKLIRNTYTNLYSR
jgi:hypothetical protein